MVNLAFCDDDEIFLKKFVPIVIAEFRKRRVDVDYNIYTNGNKLIESFKLRKPYADIVFMDIDMPYINGKALAQKLRKLDKSFKLIFITDYEQEALNTFQYDVIAFIPKDKIGKYLPDAIKRAIISLEEDRPRMQIFRVYDTYRRIAEIKIPLNDIRYIEVLQRKIFLHSIADVYELYHYQFSELVGKYVSVGFLDIHRTCIVNSKFIVKVGENAVWLDNGEELMMSRRKKKKVLEQFAKDVYEGLWDESGNN